MSANKPLRPDLYIAAIGRSGSTLLCNLLTDGKDHIIFHEPGFHAPPYRGLLSPQLEKFGLKSEDLSISHRKDLSANEILDHQYGQWLRVRKWGFKEVLSEEHEAVIAQFEPKTVVFCVRNITEVALSFFEKHRRQNNEERFPKKWVYDYCIRETAAITELKKRLDHNGTRNLVVRYEDLTSGPAYLSNLSEKLNWPTNGDTTQFYEGLNRSFETERHGSGIGRAIDAKSRTSDPIEIALAQDIANHCQDYQTYFGYADHSPNEPS